jgi:hypothetical protein
VASMTPYDAQQWQELFVAAAGAAAALDGLLFVAVSINVKDILASDRLPPLAARSLGMLLSLLLMSIFVLLPGQSRIALGIEVGALGAILVVATAVSVVRGNFPVQQWRWTIPSAFFALISTAPMVIAGISITAASGGGLYWAAAELVAGFAVAVYNAWVLLIEILR